MYSAALAGSSSALKELSYVSDHLSDSQLLDIFPLILRHINRRNIPKHSGFDSRSPDTRVRLALSSLTIVRRAQWEVDVKLGFRDLVVQFFRENWLTLWAWVELFGGWVDETYVGTREGGLDDYRQDVFDMVLFFFADVAPAKEYRSLLDSIPFLVPLMTRIWLLEAASPSHHRRMNFILDALRKLLRIDPTPGKPSTMQRFIQHMGTSNYAPISVLLNTIPRLSKQAHIPYFQLGLNAALQIVVACSQDSSRFFRSLLARRSTPIFASVMADLTSRRRQATAYTEDEMSDMEMALEMCTGYFLKCCDDGPTWVAEAIEGRLIMSIFKSRRFLSPKPQMLSEKGRLESRLQVLYVALLNSIRAHLLYPFILQGAVRSITTVESRGLELDSEKNKDLWESWMMLKDEALRRRRWKSDVYIPSRYNLCSSKKVKSFLTNRCGALKLTCHHISVHIFWGPKSPPPIFAKCGVQDVTPSFTVLANVRETIGRMVIERLASSS